MACAIHSGPGRGWPSRQVVGHIRPWCLPVAGKKRIVLKTKSAKGADLLAATVKSGLVVSNGLRSRVRKHPKVAIVLRATEVGGKTYKQRVRVPAR